VHKSLHAFLGLATDHVHEQLNAVVKGDGGIIGLSDNANAMERWIICGPDVARPLEKFECSMVCLFVGFLTTLQHKKTISARITI
jgi:hypothetical protein